MTTGTIALDKTAMGISVLCVLHCLALPVLATVLPVVASVAEAEWIHKAFVLAAIPVSFLVILRSGMLPARAQLLFAGTAVVGLLFLLSAAFAEALHDWEVMLTVIGAVLLAAAHFWRWRQQEEVG